MDLATYLTVAVTTATYPPAVGLAYPALGLAGEAVEAWQAAGGGAASSDVLAELGDVCWYVAAVARDGHVGHGELATAMITATTADDDPLAAMLAAAGTVAEQVKKTLHAGSDRLPADRRARVVAELGQVLAAIDRAARDRGADLSAVLEANLVKLADRADRGVLLGDGDHR